MNAMWARFDKAFTARKPQERMVLLGLALLLIAYAWFMLAHDVLQRRTADVERAITVAQVQIDEQQAQQAEISATYTDDPNAFSLTRQRELAQANLDADARLNELYGQLIDPREMSLVLTRILQRETALKLVRLENLPSQSLLTTTVQRSAEQPGQDPVSIEVYRHGLHMEFEGNFMETVRYLRSLEELENNFFWENFDLQVLEYPTARISLEIYTLSTERGWIGV